MKFKSITIKNFRNYENVQLDLTNKNIIFGRNDFGKTNFLHALRFLFEPRIRNKGFDKSDYHKKETSKPISILLELDISEENNDNNKFIRAKVGGDIEFSEGSFFIKLEGIYDESKQIGNPVLKWGGHLDELKDVGQKGIYSDLDEIFEVVYLHPNLSPNELFKKHRNLLYKDKDTSENEEIEKAIDNLNTVISSDARVNSINDLLTKNYKEIRKENVAIELKSEHEVNGIFNHLVPYIKDSTNNDGNLYPTSGDGRQKILAYALTNLIEERKLEDKGIKKITIFLIEEVENSLHPSMQQVVSRNLFQTNKELYPYLFLTTHSEHMFMYMDQVNLIRIFRDQNDSYTNKSYFYQVPKGFKETRKTFNELLSQTLFYDRVLLVEGMSEKILFEAVIEKIAEEKTEVLPKLEEISILSVEGIGFEDYIGILQSIGIDVIVKTDNDIRKLKEETKVSTLGINRCKKIYNLKLFQDNDEYREQPFSYDENIDINDKSERDSLKKKIFKKYKTSIETWKKANIYISEIELEEDLYSILPNDILNDKEFEGDFIGYLQQSKKENMNTFVNKYLNNYDIALSIYNDDKFECIKALLGHDVNE